MDNGDGDSVEANANVDAAEDELGFDIPLLWRTLDFTRPVIIRQ